MAIHFRTCLAILISLAAGCHVRDSARDHRDDAGQRNHVDGRKLVGMTVAKAATEAELKPETFSFTDEPPGVGRCVAGSTAGGEVVQLWVERNAGIFRENRDWTFKMFAEKLVVRVIVEKDGRRKAWPK
jgi:hypothetical protein